MKEEQKVTEYGNTKVTQTKDSIKIEILKKD